MDMHKTLDFLYSRKAKDMKLGLEHIRKLLNQLDNPENRFQSIHIAGTNGKGSTAAILESILMQAGYRTGLFTSPHLIDLEERIRINDENIPRQMLVDGVSRMRTDIIETDASFFEVMTAIGFQYFADQKVDVAIVETGLGGRLDATNTLTPELSVITEIGFDHTRILGNTLRKIAAEKAGILKPGIPAVIGSKHRHVRQFFQEYADAESIELFIAQNICRLSGIHLTEQGTDVSVLFSAEAPLHLHCNLIGKHQLDNLCTALTACRALRNRGWHIPDEAIISGASKVHWRARLDLLQTRPKILLDSAHNPLGMRRLVQALTGIFSYRRLILIFGVLADKEYCKMIKSVLPLADKIILTQPVSERALDPHVLERCCDFRSKMLIVEPDIQIAWQKAVESADEEDLICAAGSIYFVGECLRIWQKKNDEPGILIS